MKKKENRGGSREGAGRPKSSVPSDAKRYTIWLPVPIMEEVKGLPMPMAQFVRDAIQEKLDKDKGGA